MLKYAIFLEKTVKVALASGAPPLSMASTSCPLPIKIKIHLEQKTFTTHQVYMLLP